MPYTEYTKEEWIAYTAGATAHKYGAPKRPYHKLSKEIKKLWQAGYDAVGYEKEFCKANGISMELSN